MDSCGLPVKSVLKYTAQISTTITQDLNSVSAVDMTQRVVGSSKFQHRSNCYAVP